MLCEKSGMSEVLHGIIKRLGKGFYKGAAAGGAGFVKLHAVYGLIFDLDAFHILAADVKDTVYLGIKESSGIVVGNCFHLAVIQKESGLHKCLAIACGTGAHDLHILRKQRINFPDRTDGCL